MEAIALIGAEHNHPPAPLALFYSYLFTTISFEFRCLNGCRQNNIAPANGNIIITVTDGNGGNEKKGHFGIYADISVYDILRGGLRFDYTGNIMSYEFKKLNYGEDMELSPSEIQKFAEFPKIGLRQILEMKLLGMQPDEQLDYGETIRKIIAAATSKPKKTLADLLTFRKKPE